jgi:FecR protein
MKSLSPALRILSIVAVAVFLAPLGQAQNREKFGISAKAGGVNSVMGRVMVARVGQAPQLLSGQDDLVSGDVVTTGADSQAEVLLNPGSYLRVAENTEFVMVDNSLDNLLVKLVKGRVIVEATGMDGMELRINIATDRERLAIVRPGIYRINALPAATELLVRKGRVALGSDPRNIVKGGKKLTFAGGAPLIAKLSKQDKDEFDNWSKVRGETLARANQRLSARTLNGFLSASDWGWQSMFGRWGVWTWSSSLGCRTFLPFYYGWMTPYGGYYGLYYDRGGYYNRGGYYPGTRQPTIVNNPPSSGGYPGGSPVSGPTGPGSSSGSPTSGTSAPPASRPPSQAGPRDPDSGGRSINRIRDPN